MTFLSKLFKCLSLALFYCAIAGTIQPVFGQEKTNLFETQWTSRQLLSIPGVDTTEVNWLTRRLKTSEAHELLRLVSHLSNPATGQLLVAYTVLDGSFQGRIMSKGTIDSLYTRPPDGDAGVVHVAFLSAKIRQRVITAQSIGNFYKFHHEINVPAVTLPQNHLDLTFNFMPAETILNIVNADNPSYESVNKDISNHYFDNLVAHRTQDFYKFPFSKEKLIYCLLAATANRPIDSLYRYMNPLGLLHFTEARLHADNYLKLIQILKSNEKLILDQVKQAILPYTPADLKIKREVSFFFATGADGWADGDVAALDLEYYKDDYATLIGLLKHETFHALQRAVAKPTRKNEAAEHPLEATLNTIFLEGTATYISDPNPKTAEQFTAAVEKGAKILNGIVDAYLEKDSRKITQLHQQGVEAAGPFYSLGAHMTTTIVNVMGPKKLKEILPLGGVVFFKTYFKAVRVGKEVTLISNSAKKAISAMADDYNTGS